jgi:hypothetical protein
MGGSFVRKLAALYECRWYAKAPGMNSTTGKAKGPVTSWLYQPT